MKAALIGQKAFIWTNTGILLNGNFGTNFNEVLIEIHKIFIQENAFGLADILSWLYCINLPKYFCLMVILTSFITRRLPHPTVYPKKFAHDFCFAVLCCGYTLTDFPISIMLTSLALWQSNDCPSASKATLMNMDKYFMWIHHERLHNNNKAKHNITVCIFLGIYCRYHNTCCYPLQN